MGSSAAGRLAPASILVRGGLVCGFVLVPRGSWLVCRGGFSRELGSVSGSERVCVCEQREKVISLACPPPPREKIAGSRRQFAVAQR
jgi:hypothetical protein